MSKRIFVGADVHADVTLFEAQTEEGRLFSTNGVRSPIDRSISTAKSAESSRSGKRPSALAKNAEPTRKPKTCKSV